MARTEKYQRSLAAMVGFVLISAVEISPLPNQVSRGSAPRIVRLDTNPIITGDMLPGNDGENIKGRR